MVVSSFILTYEWLGRFQYSPANSLIVLSAIVMVGALAAMILSVDIRLRHIEESIESRERSMRISLLSVEDNVDRKMNDVTTIVEDALEACNRRNYR
jgi:uncharacterized Ntn-hydrolase superfamily protein